MLFDLYVPARGWLQRLDPRTKFALLGCGVLLFVAARTPLPLLALVGGLHLLLWSSRVPWGRMGWVLGQLRWLLVSILLLFPWMAAVPGAVLVRVGPLVLTGESIALAAVTAGKVWGMSLLLMALLFTTTQQEVVRGLVALGLPYHWGLTLAVALRYIPSFAAHLQQIQEAQAARGWDAGRGDIPKRLRNLGPLFVALAIHAFRTVDTLTLAMTARGVGRPTSRTVRHPLRLGRADRLLLATLVGFGIAWLLRTIKG